MQPIKYIVIIAVIILVVVLSQQPFFKQWGQKAIVDPVQNMLTKGATWASTNLGSKITGEVQKRGDIIKDEINQEKNKISENILDKAKNYFSGITNSILHPGTSQNCQPAESSNQPNP